MAALRTEARSKRKSAGMEPRATDSLFSPPHLTTLQQRQVFKPDSDSQDKGGLRLLVTPEQAASFSAHSASQESGSTEPCDGAGVTVKQINPPWVTGDEISGASFAAQTGETRTEKSDARKNRQKGEILCMVNAPNEGRA
jgi:hypothetical protein